MLILRRVDFYQTRVLTLRELSYLFRAEIFTVTHDTFEEFYKYDSEEFNEQEFLKTIYDSLVYRSMNELIHHNGMIEEVGYSLTEGVYDGPRCPVTGELLFPEKALTVWLKANYY